MLWFATSSFTVIVTRYTPGASLSSGSDFSSVTCSPGLLICVVLSATRTTALLVATFTTAYSKLALDFRVCGSMPRL